MDFTAEKLPGHEAHLRYVLTDEIRDQHQLDQYLNLLSPDERERQQRFHFERDRHLYLVSHALVRTSLSLYAPVDPSHWQFEKNQYGRPEIQSPAEFRHLRFNLSHTHGMAAFVIATGREVGVDVEDMTRKGETLAIANRFFSETEVAELKALPREQQQGRFFDYWTLKEAYIKARGMGLAIPLGQFSFHLEPGDPIRISFSTELEDSPSRWQFEQVFPNARHKIAAAMERLDNTEMRLITSQVTPS